MLWKFSGFGNSALVYLISNIVNASIPFMLMPILTRVISPEEYGFVAMFGIAVSIFNAIVGLSIHGAVSVQFFKLESCAYKKFVSGAIRLLLASTGLGLLFVYLLSPKLQLFFGLSVQWLYLAVLVASFQMLTQIMLAILQVNNRAVYYGLLQIFQTLVNGLLSLYLVLFTQLQWEGRLYGHFSAALAAGLVVLALLNAQGYLRETSNLIAVWRTVFRFGLPLVPHLLVSMLISSVDRFVIARQLGMEYAGVYTSALQLGLCLGLIADALNRSFSPWLMRFLAKPDELRKREVVKYTYLYFLFALLAALLFACLMPWFARVFLGPKYIISPQVLWFLGFGHAFGAMYLMVANYIFYFDKTVFLAGVTQIAGLTHLLLTFTLIESHGLVGAAFAFCCSQLVMFLLTWLLTSFVCDMPWKSFLKN